MSDKQGSQTESAADSDQTQAPAITLPKGGGIGEKFAANPVMGTGSVTVPITTSPGRSGFGSELSLSYDSGAGNSVFGFGWDLNLPAVTRKTNKGLPRYRDAEEIEVFLLSGAEDLVPLLDGDSRFIDDPSCIFSWLICETRDDKGNGIVYEYTAEDGAAVDLSRVHERNQGLGDDPRRSANRYLSGPPK